MEIKLLKTFVTVARLKGFSAAARELNTVQPAISRQISDLEEELGVDLFWRSTRAVRLTSAGAVLLREAQEILAHEERVRSTLRRVGDGHVGRLRVGFISSATQAFLPDLIQRFRKHYPGVQVMLLEMTARQQLEAMAQDQIDVAFSRSLPTSAKDTTRSIEIYADQLAAFIPDSHALTKRSGVSLGELAEDPFILFQRDGAPGLFDVILSTCLEAGFSPDIVHQPNSMQAVLIGVASGLGVSVAPGCITQLNMRGCKRVHLTDHVLPVPLELHYRPDHMERPASAFVDLVTEMRTDIAARMAS
ncbi:LysR family transcriptional regulator [Thalassospira lucentensis]|uniref:LysR family transcriptional regulator n=1 Tax=Thalassospira lucentensis TaxID=168935 RepID=UPI003D2EB8F7